MITWNRPTEPAVLYRGMRIHVNRGTYPTKRYVRGTARSKVGRRKVRYTITTRHPIIRDGEVVVGPNSTVIVNPATYQRLLAEMQRREHD